MCRPGPARTADHPPLPPPPLRPGAAPLPSGAQVTPGQVGPAGEGCRGRPLRLSEVSAAPGRGCESGGQSPSCALHFPPAKSLLSAGVARQESRRRGRGCDGAAAGPAAPLSPGPASLLPPLLGPQKFQVGLSPVPGAAAGGERSPCRAPEEAAAWVLPSMLALWCWRAAGTSPRPPPAPRRPPSALPAVRPGFNTGNCSFKLNKSKLRSSEFGWWLCESNPRQTWPPF